MGKLHTGFVSWCEGVLEWGAFATEVFWEFGVALWAFLSAVLAFTANCISLSIWAIAALRNLIDEKGADIHALILDCVTLIFRIAAATGELIINWWDDMVESLEVTLEALTVISREMFEYTFVKLAALGHFIVKTSEEVTTYAIITVEALWESTDTYVVPQLVELWRHIDKHLKLHEVLDSVKGKIFPVIEQGRGVAEKVAGDMQPLLEKIAEANHKVLFSSYCAFVFVVWFFLVMSENEGMVSGFLFGLMNGLGMIKIWAWMMVRRQKQRSKLTADANVLDASPQEELKKVFGEDKPPGALFEGMERVDWLNKMVRKVWPSFTAVVENHRPQLRDFLEDFMENYRLQVFQVIGENEVDHKVERYIPGGEDLKALYLNDLDLGTAAPQIGGVKLRDLKDNKMVMDMRLRWETEAQTITLGVGTSDGILRVLMEKLRIIVTVRTHIYIAEEAPFVSILVLFTPNNLKPFIQYKLTPDEDVLEHLQPVVLNRLKELIDNSIYDSLHWPNRLVVLPTWAAKPTVEVDSLQKKLHGQLSLAILKGENLVNLYPYVLLYIRVKYKVRTKSIENTHDPEWNEEFVLDAEDQASQCLVMQVMNENKGNDQLIGVVTYPLAKLEPDKDSELQLPVHSLKRDSKGKAGTLSVELRYHVYTKEEQEAAMISEKKLEEVLGAPEEVGSFHTAVSLLRG